MTDDPVVHALLDLCKTVGEHPDAMFDGSPLNAAFIKASNVLRKHVDPCGSEFASPEVAALAALDRLVEWDWQVVIEREKDGGIGLSSIGRFDVSAPTLREAIELASTTPQERKQ